MSLCVCVHAHSSQSQIPIERISLDKRKAGLQQVDANRVNKIIYEMSKVHFEENAFFSFFTQYFYI
jgi:hypothetical protein